MVGHHPTNKLIGRDPIIWHNSFPNQTCIQLEHWVLPPVSRSYPQPYGRLVTHYSPVRHSHHQTKAQWIPFDLHVLSTPPAFVLSQNQTLHTKTVESPTQAHKKIKKQRAKPHPTTKQSAASHKQTPTPHHPNRQHNMSILLAIKNPTKNHTPQKTKGAAFNQTTTYKTYKHKSSTKHALEFSNHHHTHQNTPPHQEAHPNRQQQKTIHPPPHPTQPRRVAHQTPLYQTTPVISVLCISALCPARPRTPSSMFDGCPPHTVTAAETKRRKLF